MRQLRYECCRQLMPTFRATEVFRGAGSENARRVIEAGARCGLVTATGLLAN
jgi:hypothetical protein